MRRLAMSVVLTSVLVLSVLLAPFLGAEASPAGERVTLNLTFGTLSFEPPPGYHVVRWDYGNTGGSAEGPLMQQVLTKKDGTRETIMSFPDRVGFWAYSLSRGDNPDLRALIQEKDPNPNWGATVFKEGNINVPGDDGTIYSGYYALTFKIEGKFAEIYGHLMVLLEPGWVAAFDVYYSLDRIDETLETGTWTCTVNGQPLMPKHKADAAAMVASVRVSWQSQGTSRTPTIPTEISPPEEQTLAEISPLETQKLIEVSQAQGEVYIRKGDSFLWEAVSPLSGVVLISAGSAVRTGQGSVCLKNISGQGDQVFVGEYTKVYIGEKVTKLDVLVGKIRVLMEKRGSEFNIHTPVGVAAPRGTDFIVDTTEERAEVLVLEGAVELSDLEGHKTVVVKAGESSVVVAGGLPSEPQRFDNDTVFKKYLSLFESEDEIKAILQGIETPAGEREATGFPFYLLAIPVVVITVVIILLVRRKQRA